MAGSTIAAAMNAARRLFMMPGLVYATRVNPLSGAQTTSRKVARRVLFDGMGRYEDRIVALAGTTSDRCLTAFMTWQPEHVRTDTHACFDIGPFACWPSFDPSSFMSAFRKQGQQGCIGSCASRTLLIDARCKWDTVDARDKSGSTVGLATAAKRYRNRPGMSVVGTGRSGGHQWRAGTAVSRRSGWQMQICGPGTRRGWNGSHRFLAGGVCTRLAGPS